MQLQEKQKAQHIYGLLEKQFANLYDEANRRQGVTGENLLRMLELRLDNVVFRAGWARTRPQARQFVSHGHVDVNGTRVDIPSYRVRKGDVVSPARQGQGDDRHPATTSTPSTVRMPAVARGRRGRQVRSPCASCPLREQIDVPVREQLIVELYSK